MSAQKVSLKMLGAQLRAVVKGHQDRAIDALRVSARLHAPRLIQEEIALTVIDGEPRQPVDRGHYKREWFADPIPGGVLIFNWMPYAAIIERGRRPGTWPPRDAIREWVRRKRIFQKFMWQGPQPKQRKGGRHVATLKERQESAIKSAAFVISRAIARKGIKGRFVLQRAWERLRPIIIQDVQQAFAKGTP